MKSGWQMKSSRAVFKRIRAERGTSFIELIMVIVFLSVAFIATLASLSSGIEKSVDMELIAKGMILAEQKMEQIRGHKNAQGYHYLSYENYPAESSISGSPGFSREVVITTFANYKEIKIIVHHSGMRDIELVSQFANY